MPKHFIPFRSNSSVRSNLCQVYHLGTIKAQMPCPAFILPWCSPTRGPHYGANDSGRARWHSYKKEYHRQNKLLTTCKDKKIFQDQVQRYCSPERTQDRLPTTFFCECVSTFTMLSVPRLSDTLTFEETNNLYLLQCYELLSS